VCYEGRILLDFKWGETDENSSEGEDRVSENENDSEANEEKK